MRADPIMLSRPRRAAVGARPDPSEFALPSQRSRPRRWLRRLHGQHLVPWSVARLRAARGQLGDAELLELVVAAKLAEGYDEEFPFAIETIADVGHFQGEVCDAIPEGYTHPLERICVWPNSDQPDALVTLDLPTGLRLATLTVDARQFISPSPDAGTRESVQFALAELLSQGQQLTEEFERTVNAVRPQRWWRRGHHVLSTARRGLLDRGAA
ncbi:hypothetical protein AB0M95_40270 [Sphaerisporangium sp. NPDC051017]|uniref:hypothetical protein n=1 Tax=Sphaerisporangium sp. NPDC051017 TaxID=3154636 RepID=UPI003439F273